MNHNVEVTRSFATVREMLRDRGVDTASVEALSGEDLLALAASRNVFSVDLHSCNYRIIYDLNPRFKLGDVRKLLEDAPAEAVIMVITREQPTHAARKGVDELNKDVQFFGIAELQYNVSRHTLVPLHEPVREETQVAEVMARYKLRTRYQLPLILATDVMARYLALKPGQLVRITRPSPSAGTYVLYRCCAKA